MALDIHEMGFTIAQLNQASWQKVKNMSHFVFLSFYFGAKNGSPALGSKLARSSSSIAR